MVADIALAVADLSVEEVSPKQCRSNASPAECCRFILRNLNQDTIIKSRRVADIADAGIGRLVFPVIRLHEKQSVPASGQELLVACRTQEADLLADAIVPDTRDSGERLHLNQPEVIATDASTPVLHGDAHNEH